MIHQILFNIIYIVNLITSISTAPSTSSSEYIQTRQECRTDSVDYDSCAQRLNTLILSGQSKKIRRIPHISFSAHPARVLRTNKFVTGTNDLNREYVYALSTHLQCGFNYSHDDFINKLYGDVYQGLGFGYYNLGDTENMGDPYSLYFYQGAQIAKIFSFLSLNYEWNFGASWGWKPYDKNGNTYNRIIGSKINAYINANLYLNWAISSATAIGTGVGFTHFSNGNTNIPNAGLNLLSGNFSLSIYPTRHKNDAIVFARRHLNIPFKKHVSYDLVAFGSWRRKSLVIEEQRAFSPKAYPVVGLSFSPMVNLGYKVRVGLSIDGVYDQSANLTTGEYYEGDSQKYQENTIDKQIAVGMALRTEFIMPFFTISLGIGDNLIYAKDDQKGLYQVFALKIATSRNTFIHIGYNLQEFETPNYLMLGFGYRFNNKYPRIRY